MAVTTEIPWGDGSGDKIFLTRNASEGDQVVSVSSDANTGAARSKVVTFATGVGNVQRQLTINQAAGSTIIFKLESPTSTQGYDTGVKLFDVPKSFTILCEGTWNNYNWNQSGQTRNGVFGLDNGMLFRLGFISSGQDYRNGELYQTANRYTAIIMNNTTSGKRCSSIYSRSNTSPVRRLAVRYDHTTRKVEAFTQTSGSDTQYWWIVPGDVSSDLTLKFLVGNATGTISEFEIHNTCLDVTKIMDFINA